MKYWYILNLWVLSEMRQELWCWWSMVAIHIHLFLILHLFLNIHFFQVFLISNLLSTSMDNKNNCRSGWFCLLTASKVSEFRICCIIGEAFRPRGASSRMTFWGSNICGRVVGIFEPKWKYVALPVLDIFWIFKWSL